MLRNNTATPEETAAALDALRILVEPIDLANGAPACASPHKRLQGSPWWSGAAAPAHACHESESMAHLCASALMSTLFCPCWNADILTMSMHECAVGCRPGQAGRPGAARMPAWARAATSSAGGRGARAGHRRRQQRRAAGPPPLQPPRSLPAPGPRAQNVTHSMMRSPRVSLKVSKTESLDMWLTRFHPTLVAAAGADCGLR